jgi:hypothetical protein
MKEIRRSRRLRLPRRRNQLTKPITTDDDDDDDESDLEHEIFQQKSIARSNKNANRTATTLFDTVTTLPIEDKQHQRLQSSSDQSSLFLYSINSKQNPAAISDDLTQLTITTTNTTPLTALTYSNTKQTEIGTIKIDLTELSGTDTLAISPINSDHDQSLSLDRNISLANINHKMNSMKDLIHIDDTDTSMKSVAFSKDNSLEQELLYQKHESCFIIPGVGNGDCMTIPSPSLINDVSLPITINTNINTDQRSAIRWNLKNMTGRFKVLIGCSLLGLIAGMVILVFIL